MVNRKIWLGILVIVLVFGMTVFGCEDDSPNKNGNSDPKTLIINGIPIEFVAGELHEDWDIDLGLFVVGTAPEQALMMEGFVAGTYSDDDIEIMYGPAAVSMKIPLYVASARWTGNGKYDIYVLFENWYSDETRAFKLSTVNFVSETTTVSFSNFTELSLPDTGGDSDEEPKTLVITGVPTTEGGVTLTGKQIIVAIANNSNNKMNLVAFNQVNINSATVEIPLMSATTSRSFTGTGSFYILFYIDIHGTLDNLNDDATYFYTGSGNSPITYNLTQATTTIPFSQFNKQEY
ncbi:hypothetical protein [Treponema sp. R80B11-R83G3]